MKFLHEKKSTKETLGLKDKKVLSEYNKKRRAKKLKALKEEEANGFVTKNTWELMFGWTHDTPSWSIGVKGGNKYIDKYGTYKGTYEQKARR
jgi:hypothetical protein